MKTERYIVEIEMPDGDMASSTWVCDTLQDESDIEDKGRWKVSVKECWKPSEYHLKSLQAAIGIVGELTLTGTDLKELLEQLKKLK